MKFLSSRAGIFSCSFLSGILLTLGWPSAGIASLLFVALIPLLYVENNFYEKKSSKSGRKVFWNAYLTFITFNLLTTWRVKYASFFGAVASIVCNALFMAIVFWLFHTTRKKLAFRSARMGYLSLIVYWIAFEH